MIQISAFLDLSSLDWLQRLEVRGLDALCSKFGESSGGIEWWMSDISRVEMSMGLENLKISKRRRTISALKDRRKLEIAAELGVQWLAFPCGKSNDNYSRSSLSLQTADNRWLRATTLASKIRGFGISDPDSKHVVSFVYGLGPQGKSPVGTRFLVTEDKPFRFALNRAQESGRVPEIEGYRFVQFADFINSQEGD